MPKRETTPTFITELPLVVSSQEDRELLARFQAGRQLYNACLSEALTRMGLVKDSELYEAAKQLPRDQKQKRAQAFKEARIAYRYTEYDLHSFANITAKSAGWIREKLDAHTVQTIATRAFKAFERVMFGLGRKVRFKVASRFRSMEGKSNQTSIRWKDNSFHWGKLTLQPIIDWSDPVLKHGLESSVKYCRILYRVLNGKRRWYVQLANKGKAYQKPQNYVSEGVVGVDLNISAAGIVGDDYAELALFCPNVEEQHKQKIRLQRKLSRSLREHNPENFESDFEAKVGRKTVIKKGKSNAGRLTWERTVTYKKLRVKKPLSQRVHECKCGVRMHRDLMSGYLARYIVNQCELSLQSAQDGWIGLEPVLMEAWQRYEQTTREQVSSAESRLSDSPSERVSVKPAIVSQTESERIYGS